MSAGFFLNPRKFTQGFSSGSTFTCRASLMPTTASGRCKICLKQLTSTPPQSACTLTLQRPRRCQRSFLVGSSKSSCLIASLSVQLSWRSEAGLTLSIPHFPVCNPDAGGSVQAVRSTKWWCVRFCSTAARRDWYARPTKECLQYYRKA